MIKEKMLPVRDFVLKSGKYVFPVIIVLAVAAIVFFALRVNNGELSEELAEVTGENIVSATEETEAISVVEEVPLVENTNDELYTLIATYYDAYANGNVETIQRITNYLDEIDEIRIPEMSQYIESYPEITVYTKQGPVEKSWLVYVHFQMTMYGFTDRLSGMETFYVCTDEEGKLYMNEGEVSEEELEYISIINTQDDVAELNNRVTVECNNTFMKNTNLFYYVQEVANDVQKTTGKILAQRNASEIPESGETTEGAMGETTGTEMAPVTTEEPVQTGPVYATATTTVNVRQSDSEIAEKVGKVSGGTKVEVLEQRVNGWSRVIANGKEGYIKSAYLRMAESVAGEAIGTVTATTTVNVRLAASQSAEKLGVLAGGDSAPLLERVDDWCKINYNGSVGYVKAEYVQ